MTTTAFALVDIDLSSTFGKKPVDGSTTYAETTISAVYLNPRDAGGALIPVGALFGVHFGDSPRAVLNEKVPGYEFECGHDDGLYISSDVALPGQFVQLMIVFGGADRANT